VVGAVLVTPVIGVAKALLREFRPSPDG
jgi:hypothetical protein